MKLILLENIYNLGELGDTVTVRRGYGRNYLLPRGKAVPATKANIEKFEAQRDELQRQADERLAAAEARREALAELGEVVFEVPVSPEGRLYGSINPHEIAEKLTRIDRKSTRLNSSHVAISYAVFCLKKKARHEDEVDLARARAEEDRPEADYGEARRPGGDHLDDKAAQPAANHTQGGAEPPGQTRAA